MKTNLGVIKAYMREMPKIEAAESLRHVDEIAMGNGLMSKADQSAILRGWRKAAGIKPKNRTKVGNVTAHEGIGLAWQTRN